MLRDARFIARSDLTLMLRQKETLLWVFLMPLIFFYFIGTVTGGFGGGSEDRPDVVALRAPDSPGFVVDALVERLEAQNLRVVRPESDEEFDRYVRRLEIRPPGGAGRDLSVTEAVVAGEEVEVRFSSRAEGPGGAFDEVRVARAVYTLLADLVVARGNGEPDAAGLLAVAETPRFVSLRVEQAGQRIEPPSGFAQAIPGTMVMFTMLVLLTSGAISLVIERKEGLLRRLASTPISPASIVLGKWAARMALGAVQIGFAMLAGTVFFRMDWGPTLPMVFLLLLGWAAFNASLALLMGNLARTEGQMAGIGVLTTMVLAALGGAWWPIEITPEWMQTLALFLPTGIAMDAMHELVNFGRAATAALPHLAVLAVGTLLVGWAGTRTFRYQ